MDIRWVENVRKGFKKAMKEKEKKARTTGEEKSFDVDPAGWGVAEVARGLGKERGKWRQTGRGRTPSIRQWVCP